jgi:hypothetical protein
VPIPVVQWATGAVGRPQLQELIEHPDLELIGVLVYDAAKEGIDAGALCGLPDTGVLATTDKEAIFALGADVVIHAASKAYAAETNAEDICRLLSAGSTVISTTSYNHLPTYGPDVEAKFVDACMKGGSRFHAAGENPGFMMERLVTTVTGLSKHIDRVDLYEAVDVSDIASPQMMFDLMGMGRTPEEITVDSPIVAKLDMAYRQALNGAAAVMGIELDGIRVAVDTTTLPHDLDVAAGTVSAGTVAGQRLSWFGEWRGRDLLAIHEEWIATYDLPQWNLQAPAPGQTAPLIRVAIRGIPNFDLQLNMSWGDVPPSLEGTNPGHLMIGMSAIRAIPDVLASPPGIVTAPVFGALVPRR